TIFLILLMTLPALSQNKITVPLSQPNSPGSLEINLLTANLRVTGYDGKEVIINYNGDVDEDARDNKRSTRDGLRRISNNSAGLEVQQNNNKVSISSSMIPREIDLDIQVPRNFAVKISIVHGDELLIENINGEIEV